MTARLSRTSRQRRPAQQYVIGQCTECRTQCWLDATSDSGCSLLAVDYGVYLVLGLIRGYSVLITICVLLLRSDISVKFSFTAMRIIGTIAGAEIGLIIIANVHRVWLLSSILLASISYAVRNVNYAFGTVL